MRTKWRSLSRYVRQALWVVPLIAMLLELALMPVLRELDTRFSWTLLGLGLSGARSMLETFVSMALSFMVFTFGSLLVAIQVASGQLTPRVIATTLLRDNVVRYTVGLFAFTLIFAINALNRLEPVPHQLVLLLAVVLGLSSIAAFLYLIDYAARLLRPIAILARIAEGGLTVIEQLYPQQTQSQPQPSASPLDLGPPARIIEHTEDSQIILTVNVEAMVAQAEATGIIIEMIPSVGDFIGKDEPLFAIYGEADAIDDDELRAMVSFGTERTMEQDPTFSFRIVIDIALKALSPAINDPTTAVLAIDQLQRLLRMVGKRHLRNDHIPDATGRLCAIFRTPNWDDYVHLSFSEIRRYGADSFQVSRRLRAMIENLTLTLPEHRHPALQQQMLLLDRLVESSFAFPEDLALARVPDPQGLGGAKISLRSIGGGTHP